MKSAYNKSMQPSRGVSSLRITVNQRAADLNRYDSGEVMNKSSILLPLVLVLVGCAAPPALPPNPVVLHVDQNVLEDAITAPGWLAYGLAHSAWKPEYLDDGSPDLFKREIYARETLADVWKELKQNGSASIDPSLDALESVNDAGFMPEYLWEYLRDAKWKEPENLELVKFGKWAKTNLSDHTPAGIPGASSK